MTTATLENNEGNDCQSSGDSPTQTTCRILPSTSYATLNSQFSMAPSGESNFTSLPAHTAATLCSLTHYPPTVTQTSHTLASMFNRQPDGTEVASPTSEATIPPLSNDILVTVPVHAPVYAGHLKTLVPEANPNGGSQARWYRREFRFDGRLLCCLDAYKCRAPPDTLVDHPQQEDKPYWPTDPYPTPALNSPLLATPTKTASYLAGKQEPVKYFQRLLWSLPVSDIEGIEVICPPATAQGVIDAALNAVSYARRKRQRARERCLVLRTMGGNVRVLRAESVRDLQRWAYILTQAWAMYVWVGRARETVNELAATSVVINPSVNNLPISTATSIHGVARPISTSTPIPQQQQHQHHPVDTANSDATTIEADHATSPVNADKSQLTSNDGERTYLSREDARAHVLQSFVKIKDEKDAETYEHYKSILQGEGKNKSPMNTNTVATKPVVNTKSDQSISSNRSSRLEVNNNSDGNVDDEDDEDDDEEEGKSLADSMRALNGEHQKYSQQSQQASETPPSKSQKRSLTDYSISAAILPAALMEKALDMADQEEAERKQRLQAVTTGQYSNNTTAPSASRSSASAMITAAGGSVTTVTRRTSRPTRTSSTGRVRRGLSTLRRERRPRRVEVVLVDGDDRVLTRSSSVSQNNGAEPKLQARVARIQSTKGVIIRLSDPGISKPEVASDGTATSDVAQSGHTAADEQLAASPKTSSTDNKYNDGMDSVGSDLKRRGAKRSPICFGSNNNSSSNSNNSNSNNNNTGASTSLREAIANRSRSNSMENPTTSPRKSVSIAGGPRVHTTDVDVVAPTPRPVPDTTNLQRCADILSHKPSDASIAKPKEKSERSKDRERGERERDRYNRDHADTSRHRRSSHYANEDTMTKHKDTQENEDKYKSRKHRSSEASSFRRRSSHIANGNGRWDDLDENWVDDDDDNNWYDRRSHRAATSDKEHPHRRSYDSYHAAYPPASLHGDYRGPPMPPPPPPPMPPRHPGAAHYPYYHENTSSSKSVRAASYQRYPPPYDGMPHSYHSPSYPYAYNHPYYQSASQALPPPPPRLSLGTDRSSTATFGNGNSDQQQQHHSTQMPLTNGSAPVDPYGTYSTELYPPPQSRRPPSGTSTSDRHSSYHRTRDDPSGSTDDKENSGSGRKSMRLRRKEGRS